MTKTEAAIPATILLSWGIIGKVTSSEDLSFRDLLRSFLSIGKAGGVFVFTRTRDKTWKRCCSAIRQGAELLNDAHEKSSFNPNLLDYFVTMARGNGAYLAPLVEYIPTWTWPNPDKDELDAINDVKAIEKYYHLNELESELPTFGPTVAFLLGFQMIGNWKIGECMLVISQPHSSETPSDPYRLIEESKSCLAILHVYLAEVNSHLLRKMNIDKLEPHERRSCLNDGLLAAAYVRSVCRLVSLWREHPEVGIEHRPGITIENLAYILNHHKKGAFMNDFTPDKALEALDNIPTLITNSADGGLVQ